jgi:LysR family hydrogen peroxide-inducible transcriptional activator
MTLIQLQYVLAVAKYKNFTLAAEKTYVTQPTLSMQIQKLEEELGIILFDRSKKPIQLTDIGKRIIQQATQVVQESGRIRDIVEQQKGFIGGDFKLGIISTVMPTLLPMFLRTFIRKYPKVHLKIEEQHTSTILQQLKEGFLDAAIAATPLGNPDIRERPLYFEPFVAYIPDAHRLYKKKKIEITDLSLEDMLLLEEGHCFRDGVINLCKAERFGKNESFQLESGSFEMMIRLVNEGLGMTLLPYLQTLELKETEQKQLRYFTDPVPAREISLIYHKNELKIQLIEALHQVISGIIRGAIVFQNVQVISPVKR